MDKEMEVIASVSHTPCGRCSDYDDECDDVVNPFSCWAGNENLGIADGYCPMWGNRES